ncbi:hypothetical protein JOC77_001044 [Peribacillus deserti]|uniref:Uncharacterized protein n=1 Tax=Peribacillus deserti TaxID=673318 RepID=A0ABS2QER8_9BACI|nr:hypothetical protein [Peribacillus deserti]MBM7691637.1 hypothetical protein [Peribacillus deserti]
MNKKKCLSCHESKDMVHFTNKLNICNVCKDRFMNKKTTVNKKVTTVKRTGKLTYKDTIIDNVSECRQIPFSKKSMEKKGFCFFFSCIFGCSFKEAILHIDE